MKKWMQNEKGFAVPLALMVMLVLVLLGTALWYYSTSETLQVARAEQDMKAHYLARSGMDITQETLRREREQLLDADTDAVFYFSGLLLDDKEITYSLTQPSADAKDVVIKVEWDASEKTGQIISTGYSHELNDKISCEFEADMEPESGGSFGWYDPDTGVVQNNPIGVGREEIPVAWNMENTRIIFNDNASLTDYASPAMYFVDANQEYGAGMGGGSLETIPIPSSLLLEHNSQDRFQLYSNFISFRSNVFFIYDNNSNPNLPVFTYDSANNFSDGVDDCFISGMELQQLNSAESLDLKNLNNEVPDWTVNYGLLYLEAGADFIKLADGNVTSIRGGISSAEDAFYLFPNGIRMANNADQDIKDKHGNITKVLGLASLIKLDANAVAKLDVDDYQDYLDDLNQNVGSLKFYDYSD